MNIELLLIVLLVCAFGLLFYLNDKKSEKETSQASYSSDDLIDSENIKNVLLVRYFEPTQIATAKLIIDDFGFSFIKNTAEFLPNPSSAQVQKIVESIFDAKDKKAAREIIEQYGPNKPHQTRVQLAIIFLSSANLDNLKNLVLQAKTDWKRVCHQAEQPFTESGFKNYVTWLMRHSTEFKGTFA